MKWTVNAMQRKDVDSLRPLRAQVAGPHHHHHLHHQNHHRSALSSVSESLQGHRLTLESTKALRLTEAINMLYGGLLPPGMGLGSMPLPFVLLSSEWPPPGFTPHKQRSSKMVNRAWAGRAMGWECAQVQVRRRVRHDGRGRCSGRAHVDRTTASQKAIDLGREESGGG